MDRVHQIYESIIQLIPHKAFTFAKLWILYAKFLIRQSSLSKARKVLGHALGTCPKSKLFNGYIEIELQLREFDRVRSLYQKYLEWNPEDCVGWIKFSELENSLGDTERARGILEIAVNQPSLDMPEYLWKAYVDFEVREGEWEKGKALYERLLEKTEHVKVKMGVRKSGLFLALFYYLAGKRGGEGKGGNGIILKKSDLTVFFSLNLKL